MWSSESCILLKYSKQLERRPEALERARNLCQLLCEGFAALLLYLKHSPIFSYFSNLLPPLTSSLSAANLLHNVPRLNDVWRSVPAEPNVPQAKPVLRRSFLAAVS